MLLWAYAAGSADHYPTRAVRLIIPFPPAGAGDILGRMLSAKLSESFGQQFVNDNRPIGGTPQDAVKFTQAEITRWSKLIQDTKLAVQ